MNPDQTAPKYISRREQTTIVRFHRACSDEPRHDLAKIIPDVCSMLAWKYINIEETTLESLLKLSQL